MNDSKLLYRPNFGRCKVSSISMRTIRYQHVHGCQVPLKRTNDHDEGVFRSFYELYVVYCCIFYQGSTVKMLWTNSTNFLQCPV